jgi:mRNA-degrading endonuclease RelE of RelBE toxin-antitoxin system
VRHWRSIAVPLVKVTFIETPVFTHQVTRALSDEEYSRFQAFLAEQPTAGTPINGTGGARKIRWSDPGRGKGTRGGIRTIYFYRDRHEQIVMLYLYSKDEQDDLTQEQKKMLKTVIKSWK